MAVGFSGTVKVHPHVCGENIQSQNQKQNHIGTPPRVWGKLSGGEPLLFEGRYTPTCVGKTHLEKAALCSL